MRRIPIILLCYLVIACEPIKDTNTEDAGITDATSSTSTSPVAGDDGNTSNAILTNLTLGLRNQFVQNYVHIFSNLMVQVDGTNCNLSRGTSSLTEIPDIFAYINAQVKSCLAASTDKELKVSELKALETILLSANGAQYLPACQSTSDCEAVEESDFSGVGNRSTVFSKKVHGLEGDMINTETIKLIQDLLQSTNTDDPDAVINDIPSPPAVESTCFNNVCKLIN